MQGQILEGKVECIVPGGEGIVRHGGTDFFVANVVAGDEVQFEVSQKRRGVWRGRLLYILIAASQRIAAPCAVAHVCGGCALQPLPSSEQALLKSSWVKQAFQAWITAATSFTPIQAQTQTFAGRRRVRWFLDHGTLGFRQRSSHKVINTTQCIALTPSLDALRQQLEAQMHVLPQDVSSIQAIELHNGFHLIFESTSTLPLPFPDLTWHTDQHVQCWWRQGGTTYPKPIHRPVRPLFDHIALAPLSAAHIDIQIGVNDFIQGHQQGNQQLIEQILRWSQGSKRVVDFFSGCGNLSLPMAAACSAHIVGAELNSNSVQAANHNAQRLQLDASYQTIDLFGKFKLEPFVAADTLILDPPRKGAKHICNIMNKLFPKQIIMVNCDLAAGARDASLLHQQGYQLKALRPLDLFPLTGHVEVMSLWVTT